MYFNIHIKLNQQLLSVSVSFTFQYKDRNYKVRCNVT